MHERIVRELIVRGHLEPVEAGVSDNRIVRYVTVVSVRVYVERSRAAGAWSMRVCSKCKGMRHVRPGTTLCGPCADRLAELEEARAERRRERKREWWRENGPAWRERRREESRAAQSTDQERETA